MIIGDKKQVIFERVKNSKRIEINDSRIFELRVEK